MKHIFKITASASITCLALLIPLAASASYLDLESRSQPELERPEKEIRHALQNTDYIITLDGGGTKTEMVILDIKGNILPLFQDGKALNSITVRGSNVDHIGTECFDDMIKQLFTNLKVGTGTQVYDFKQIAPKCAIVGGFSGLGSLENRKKSKALFEKYGFSNEKLALCSDSALSLLLVEEQGSIIISGTGSACLARIGGHVIRAGNIPDPAGNQAGGNFIGAQALKRAAQHECGWDEPTALTDAFRQYFNTDSLVGLLEGIRINQISKSEIAALTPIVFQKAHEGDPVAKEILDTTAHYLANLIAFCSKKADRKKPFKLFLIGGTFRNEFFEDYAQSILNSPKLKDYIDQGLRIEVINVSHKSIFPDIVRNFLTG